MNQANSALPIQYINTSEEAEKSICQRCKTEDAILISRKEKFCQRCFVRFIRGKQRKQMNGDKFRVKYGEVAEKLGHQKILLALSCGVSSIVLFDVIASLLKEQLEGHKGKQGFELVLLNLDEFELKSLDNHAKKVIPNLLERFEGIDIQYKILNLQSFILDQSLLQKIKLTKQFSAFSEKIDPSESYSMESILNLCPNKSSVEDFLTVVYDELILRTAYLENCETIIYGHSMTRIANEILGLTVKGRGSSIHEAIADHTVTYREKKFEIQYPLRDVLLAEIIAYSELEDLDQYQLKSTKPVSKITKNMTIRDITTQYFNHLDNNGYASTASTVVKTGEKLGPPKIDGSTTNCQLCGVEIHHNPKDWLRRITVSEAMPLETEEEEDYKKQYLQLFGNYEDEDYSDKDPVNVCYGCIVSLGGIKPYSGFIWPVKTDKESEHDILNEYILTDDED